jgi:Flp pilus assembly protein TadD
MALAHRVLLVGWAGADWTMIHPLLDAGQMPHLERIVNQGCIGRIGSLHPHVEPLVWNSIATGTLPHRHGIAGYLKRNGETVTPASGVDNRAPAFWQTCSAAGMKVNVVNWPTYPAESISGTFVSNLFARFGKQKGSPYRHMPRAIAPKNVDALDALRIDPHEFCYEDLLAFVPQAAKVDQQHDPALAILASRLGDAVSAHAMTTAVLDDDWHVAAVCYDLIDRLAHSFIRFHPPRGHVSRQSFELYRGVMNAAYRFCDQMLGSLLALAGDDAHVIVFSDHGFRSGADRPPAESWGRGDDTCHRSLGMIALRGPAFHADRWIWGGTLLSICPTLYALTELATDGLDGRPLLDAFKSPPQAGRLNVHVQHSSPPPPLSAEELEGLQTYLLDEGFVKGENIHGENAPMLAEDACDFNLAQSHLQFGNITAALELLLRCHERRPDIPRFAIAAARCHVALGNHAAASALVHRALEHGVPQWHGDLLLGQLHFAEGDLDAALERFLASHAVRPQQRELNAQIGAVYERLGRADEARRAFSKELELDEDNARALLGLGKLELTAGNHDSALEYLLASAASEEYNPDTHFRLAQTLAALHRTDDALRALDRALRQAPGHPEALKLRQQLASSG